MTRETKSKLYYYAAMIGLGLMATAIELAHHKELFYSRKLDSEASK